MEFFVPPARPTSGSATGSRSARDWYVPLRHRAGATCACARTRRQSSRTTRAATSDLEYQYPIGWGELEGIANRGDYDLKQHTEFSGAKLEFVEPDGERYVPHVIEPAAGADRAFLAFLCDAYDEEEVAGRERVLLRLHPRIAPVKAAILPLLGNDAAQGERAAALAAELRAALPGRARHERRHRPPLPPPGRDRHALGDHRRPRVARRRCRDGARPRLARADPRAARRSCASCSSSA